MYLNMKTYSDLQDIDSRLHLYLELEPVGRPEVEVIAGNHYAGGQLFTPARVSCQLDLLSSFMIQIELKNKIYDAANETAVIIRRLRIDNIDLVPRFDYLAVYRNDHDFKDPTNYLGFNGKWTLTIDRPFYQWLHQVTGQGWLLG